MVVMDGSHGPCRSRWSWTCSWNFPDVLHDVVKSQRDAFLASLAVAGLLSCLVRLVLCYWHWNLPQHGSTAPWGDRASKRYGPLIDSR